MHKPLENILSFYGSRQNLSMFFALFAIVLFSGLTVIFDPFFALISILALFSLVIVIKRELRFQRIVVISILAIASFNFFYIYFFEGSRSVAPAFTRVIKDVIFLFYGIALIRVFATKRLTKQNMQGLAGWLIVAIVFFVNLLFISDVSIVVKLVSARYYILYPLLGIFSAWIVTDGKWVWSFINTYWIFSTIVSLLGLLSVFGIGGNSYANVESLFGYNFPRTISTLGDPNNLAIFLMIALILYIAIVLSGYRSLIPASNRFSPVLWVITILTTFSRGALLLGGISTFVLIVVSKRIKASTIFWIVLIAVSASLIIAQRSQGLSTGALQRVDIWLSISEELDLNSDPLSLWIGNGLGFLYASTDLTDLSNLQSSSKTFADNAYVSLLYSTGIIGLFSYFLLVAYALFFSFRVSFQMSNPLDRYMGLGLSVAQFFILFQGLLLDIFVVFPAIFLFWLFNGIVKGMKQSQQLSNQKTI